MKTTKQVTLAAIAMALLLGCAHAKVKEERVALQNGAVSPGDLILVKEVSADHTTFSGDKASDTAKVSEEKAEIRSRFAIQIVHWLKKKGFKAVPYSADKAGSGAVLSANVSSFDHGSGAARFLVGMGAGSSNMTVQVRLTRGGRLLSDFDVVATSGGRGGIDSMGTFIDAHIFDGAERIAEYLAKHVKLARK